MNEVETRFEGRYGDGELKEALDNTQTSGTDDIILNTVAEAVKPVQNFDAHSSANVFFGPLNIAEPTNSNAIIILQNKSMYQIDRFEFIRISLYFRAVFSTRMMEAASLVISLQLIKPEVMRICCEIAQQLLKGADHRAVLDKLNLHTAFEVLSVASYLVMEPVLQVISDFIVTKVNAATLLSAYRAAENRYIPLAGRLWRIIVSEFNKLLTNETFLLLRESEFLKILDDEHLNVRPEEECRMIQRWIKSCDENGMIITATTRKKLSMSHKINSFGGFRTRIPNSIILASGGWCPRGPTTLLEAYDMHAQRWIHSGLSISDGTRAYHATINCDNKLFTIGGFNGHHYYRSVRKFEFETLDWDEIASMHDRRCYVSCTAIDSERIMALGGYDGHDRLRTVEIFHIPTNQWTRVAQMNTRRSDAHCVFESGSVYAVGGFDGLNCHGTAEYYDPNSDRWFLIPAAMNSRRSGVSAACQYGGIVVCGGFNGISRLHSCELFDPREGHWHRLRSMIHPRSNFGIEVLDNLIVVAGGYGGIEGTMAEVEAYDFRANSWLEMPTLGLRRSALYLTRIDNHNVIDEFIRPIK